MNTDKWQRYVGLDREYVHNVIDHAEEYVRGNVHTNGIANFGSLLKRAIRGTYVSVEPFHLFRYLDEEAFDSMSATSPIGLVSRTLLVVSSESA